jgi:PAS domain S-box-containing protein
MECLLTDGKPTFECYQNILETMAEAVFIVDEAGRIRYANRALSQLTGYATAELLAKNCRDLMACATQPDLEYDIYAQWALEQSECLLKTKSGARIPVLKNGRVLKAHSGSVNGAVQTLTDLSMLKKIQEFNKELQMSLKEKSGFGSLIGKSKAMFEVFELMRLAAASNATVLISGESGTGKELVVNTIHDESERREGPLVKVNCAALPENLLESELFGHARGSFTGAVNDRQGRFEMADGGTLMLDEIGEISPLIQVKLLRFLQEKEFERVGESRTRKSDVRVVAATHRNLREMVRKGSFREDLYYRLKVFPIHLPALRERKEDVGLLVDHFIEKFRKETRKPIIGLSHEAAITLMDYCWPGNIRELENAIEHAFVTCQSGQIDMFDLPLDIRRTEMRTQACFNEPADVLESNSYRWIPPQDQVPQSTPVRYHKPDRATMLDLLEKFGSNQSAIAEYLGVDRSTVWRRLKKFNLL